MKGDGRLEDTKSNDYYRYLFESVRDPILIIRADGRIIDANKALAEALGYSKEELLRMNVADLRPQVVDLKVREHLEKSYQGYSFETAYMRKDGSILPVEISAKGAMLGSQKVLFAVIRDITERKRVEESLKEAKQQTEFYVDLMGHDINNMNQSAMGYLELALQQMESEKRLRLEDRLLIDR